VRFAAVAHADEPVTKGATARSLEIACDLGARAVRPFTSESPTDRLLGTNVSSRSAITTLFVCTGNDLVLRGDIPAASSRFDLCPPPSIPR
jgi:hypothetical protein